MRLLFAGTPEVALPALNALVDSPHEVVAVLTRPDAPVGRRRRLTPSPVKARALELGLPVLTPTTLRDTEVLETLRTLDVDAAPVVAYGNLVPADALAIPRLGWINLHFSLLPAWRGAAPAQRAVLSGAERTGMSVFRLDEGLDTGDLITTAETDIGPLETSGELLARLAQEGAPLLLSALEALAEGTAALTPQSEEGATHAAKLTSQEALLDLALPADRVGAQIRGMSPQPGAWSTLHGQRFKILGLAAPAGSDGPDRPTDLGPGELHATKKHLWMGTGSGPLALGTVAPFGKKAMRGVDWARGAGLEPGTRLLPPVTDQETTA